MAITVEVLYPNGKTIKKECKDDKDAKDYIGSLKGSFIAGYGEYACLVGWEICDYLKKLKEKENVK